MSDGLIEQYREARRWALVAAQRENDAALAHFAAVMVATSEAIALNNEAGTEVLEANLSLRRPQR